ncbi:hypothetical protein [Sphingobacterium bambusae]|uniref:DUF4178 domain-containing protein n=1 Tax=Sphingobacterium bambusae TaxID=662858 RepID=A0ABW6BDB9_9SPHI|nr:hypothetical protein [Sphingobacterium bambusae]WPL48758.1 hypothetical protein SCB77_22670 [Sphingobacterium bambusae]
MSPKQVRISKIIKILIFCLIAGIALFVLMLYSSIKTKSTNISRYEPFRAYVGKTWVLQCETYLFQEDDSYVLSKKHPFTLMDREHEQWTYFQDRMALDQSDVKLILKIPAGTEFTLREAVQYTNGVSGFSSPTVLGTISYDKKHYPVSYRWGTLDLAKSLGKVENCWKFQQAPWQETVDTAHYALPDAEWW